MLFKFHDKTTDKDTIIPTQNIKYVVDGASDGADIYTNIPTTNPDKTKIFRSTENVQQLFIKNRNS